MLSDSQCCFQRRSVNLDCPKQYQSIYFKIESTILYFFGKALLSIRSRNFAPSHRVDFQ